MRYVIFIGAILIAACSAGSADDESTSTTSPATTATTNESAYPPPPELPDGPVDAELAGMIDEELTGALNATWDPTEVVDVLVKGADPRTAWLLADLMRFYQIDPEVETLATAFTDLTGVERDSNDVEFVWASNHLIAWDLPAWDGYPEAKQKIFGSLTATWNAFFEGDHGLDWRLITWGGVGPDTRPLDDNGDCRCIPALDHPETTDAAGGDWYADNRIVFGVTVEDEAIALPKHQMEVHEMVHVTLGGRELGIPYCTLCGSAQAYLVDDVPGFDQVVLRTSGLLSRSNKLMYDLTTGSAIDTFTGRALSGPLGADEVTLEQVSVVASTWGDWKEAHPGTRIVAEDGGIGRTYSDDPLGDRDEAGPIFPVGDVDSRLRVHQKVVGVVAPDGTPIAFPVEETREALADGDIEFEGVTVRLDDSIRVYDADGNELVSHEAFWFAWSQFHDGTLLWAPEG